MGKPQIIGYKDEYTGPPGFTLGLGDSSAFVRRRPIYAPRNFHATPAHGGYRVHCRMCGKTTLTGGSLLPHDTAERHVVNGCCYVP